MSQLFMYVARIRHVITVASTWQLLSCTEVQLHHACASEAIMLARSEVYPAVLMKTWSLQFGLCKFVAALNLAFGSRLQ